jgi:micrococcal nuclease
VLAHPVGERVELLGAGDVQGQHRRGLRQPAGDALRALAPQGAVLTVAADREPVDRFGRALLYAWTGDGVFVNEALVRGGYAEAVLVGRNDRWIDRLRAAERDAQDAGEGLWGECPDR